MHTYVHPRSQAPIIGMRLAAGAVLQQGDVYDSTTGTWEACTSPGVALGKTETIWVRPGADLSNNARELLARLVRKGSTTCLVKRQRDRNYYVTSNPGHNWDGRMGHTYVKHPECVQELVEYGLLVRGEHAVENWHADCSECAPDAINETFTLTEEGSRFLAN